MKNILFISLILASCNLSSSTKTVYPKKGPSPEVVSVFSPHGCGNIDIRNFIKEYGHDFSKYQDVDLVEIEEGIYAPEEMWPQETIDTYMRPIFNAYPLPYDVMIVATRNAPWWGLTRWDFDKSRFEIWMNMDGSYMFGEIFAHEWAHAATWDVPESSHGSAWAVLYGGGYRALIGEE